MPRERLPFRGWLVPAFAILLMAVPVVAFDAAGAPPTSAATHGSFPTPIRHVIVVYLENAELSTVLAQGSFEEHLFDAYAHATQTFAVCHPSEPNYLAGTSGSPQGRCGTDAYVRIAVRNVADLVEARNETWAAYEESMPVACDTHDAHLYAVKHDPFVFYSDIVGNRTRCDTHVLPWASWNATVANGTVPNYAFITPNLRDDGHNTTVAFADRWLQRWITPLRSAPWFSRTVFLIVYDEGTTNWGANGTAGGGHIYLTTVSPYTWGGGADRHPSTLVNLLTTTEWLLGLGRIGGVDNWTSHPPLTAMFRFPAGAPSGTVLTPRGGASLEMIRSERRAPRAVDAAAG